MINSTENHCGAGRRGEALALLHLQKMGYTLVRQNYRNGRGEIDLVMDDPNGVLVFVEVKTNRSSQSGYPLERIDGRKIRQVQRMAQRYCWEFSQENRDIRFDVIGVQLKQDGSEEIEHIPSAFLPDMAGYYLGR